MTELFSEYGTIIEIIAKTNLKAKGQAFIVFDNVESATNAIEEINGFELFDKSMSLDYAKTRSDATVLREGGSEELETHKRRRLAEKGLFFFLHQGREILYLAFPANLPITKYCRAQASPRSTRSPEETQTPRRRSRNHSSCQNDEGCWSQTHDQCSGDGHSRRIPASEQDPVLAGPSRQCRSGNTYYCIWEFRRIHGSKIGAREKRNRFRGV